MDVDEEAVLVKGQLGKLIQSTFDELFLDVQQRNAKETSLPKKICVKKKLLLKKAPLHQDPVNSIVDVCKKVLPFDIGNSFLDKGPIADVSTDTADDNGHSKEVYESLEVVDLTIDSDTDLPGPHPSAGQSPKESLKKQETVTSNEKQTYEAATSSKVETHRIDSEKLGKKTSLCLRKSPRGLAEKQEQDEKGHEITSENLGKESLLCQRKSPCGLTAKEEQIENGHQLTSEENVLTGKLCKKSQSGCPSPSPISAGSSEEKDAKIISPSTASTLHSHRAASFSDGDGSSNHKKISSSDLALLKRRFFMHKPRPWVEKSCKKAESSKSTLDTVFLDKLWAQLLSRGENDKRAKRAVRRCRENTDVAPAFMERTLRKGKAAFLQYHMQISAHVDSQEKQSKHKKSQKRKSEDSLESMLIKKSKLLAQTKTSQKTARVQTAKLKNVKSKLSLSKCDKNGRRRHSSVKVKAAVESAGKSTKNTKRIITCYKAGTGKTIKSGKAPEKSINGERMCKRSKNRHVSGISVNTKHADVKQQFSKDKVKSQTGKNLVDFAKDSGKGVNKAAAPATRRVARVKPTRKGENIGEESESSVQKSNTKSDIGKTIFPLSSANQVDNNEKTMEKNNAKLSTLSHIGDTISAPLDALGLEEALDFGQGWPEVRTSKTRSRNTAGSIGSLFTSTRHVGAVWRSIVPEN